MSRPLLNKSHAELREMVYRNSLNAAELGLVEAELRHRKTKSAAALLAETQSKLLRLLSIPSIANSAKAASRPKRLNASVEIPQSTLVMAKDSSMSNNPTSDEKRWTDEAVASLRKKLIDLGKRNPLISFKHSNRGGSSLRIVDERPDILFDALCVGGIGFEPLPGEDTTPPDELTPTFLIEYERARLTDETFREATKKLGDDESDAIAMQAAERQLRKSVRAQLGLPPVEYGTSLDVRSLAKIHGFDPNYDLKNSDDGDVEDHQNDDRMRVLLTEKDLQKRLKAIWERYRSHARETGLHTLFLVFGFAEWFEDDNSDVSHFAPVLLLSVQLERTVKKGRYEYSLTAHEDGLQTNVALAEKMRVHFGLEMPSLRTEESPESYFIRIADVLGKGSRLSLRRFATLAVLPFPRMVLWKDLDPSKWHEDAFVDHPLLPLLLGARSSGASAGMGETHDVETSPWAEQAPALVQPADASQHSALIDIVAGRSVAIEGPPGTGKSQTITNMIAAALSEDKTVLFVAEKQAALNVVAGRLKAAGFGPLLLELHSDGTNKTDMMEGLRQRLSSSASSDQSELESSRDLLKKKRELIRRYLALIGSQLGRIGRSAYWLAWREINLRDMFDAEMIEMAVNEWLPDEPLSLDRTTLQNNRAKLQQFGQALDAIDAYAQKQTRTAWINASVLPIFGQEKQIQSVSAAGKAAKHMSSLSGVLQNISGLSLPTDPVQVAQAIGQIAACASYEDAPREVVLSALRDIDGSKAVLESRASWSRLFGALEVDVSDPSKIDEVAGEQLASALRALPRIPPTVQEFQSVLAQCRATRVSLSTVGGEIRELLDLLSGSETLSSASILKLVDVLADLGRVPPGATMLLDLNLLGPVAKLAIERETQRANQLAKDQDHLLEVFTSEAFELDPAELAEQAETLEQTGLMGRLLGGRYKSANRATKKFLRSPLDRLEASSAFSKLSRHIRSMMTFRQESSARMFFPEPVWDGAASDWASLISAQEIVTNTHTRLANDRLESTFSKWLALAGHQRDRLSITASRAAPLLEQITQLGFGESAFSDLDGHLSDHCQLFEDANRAIQSANAKSDGLLLRGGANLGERLVELQEEKARFADLAGQSGFSWLGSIEQPLDALEFALDVSDRFRSMVGPLPIGEVLSTSEEPKELVDAVVAMRPDLIAGHQRFEDAFSQVVAECGTSPLDLVGGWNAERSYDNLAEELSDIAKDTEGARLAADLLRYRNAIREFDCDKFCEWGLNDAVPIDRLGDLYELIVSRAILQHYLGSDGQELSRLGSLSLDEARNSFVVVDRELQRLEAKAIISKRLRRKAPWGVNSGPKGQWTEAPLIEHELSLKKPRTPIRDLTDRAGAALQVLKPVWMMSPTSAAQYIKPGKLAFDLLIVDEASQMRPEFALSAIMRSEQFVVVGDSNQLPPTDFFATSTDNDDDVDDDAMTVDTESILDLANSRFQHRRRLKWHYRSQHEGLIQFSNRQFYDRDLVVFPSPTTDDDLLGVKHVYVGGHYEASINQQEAQAVIEEAFRLMCSYPDRSLGIATMNAKQTDLIRNEFDRLILEQPAIRNYVDAFAGSIDEFFIKNLENVQGDERDIILISTVYGPDSNGRVMQRFGPINSSVGHRRLNVIVTRARLSTRLFTSLRSSDIKVTESSNAGVLALQAYLTYAEKGAQFEDAGGGEPDSDFEVFVADRLLAAGYEVVHQVGVEGFRIDIGVRHPDYPIGFIAGIECDGATFHSGLTVRDRDRIRQSVLEGMGWKIYRIWSTDWFSNPDREMAKLLDQLGRWRAERAQEYNNRPEEAMKSIADEVVTPEHDQEQDFTKSAQPVQTEHSASIVDAEAVVSDVVEEVLTKEPTGKPMRALDGIEWYETRTGRLYEIWLAGDLAGTVEVLSRATSAPQIYAGHLRIGKSEYQGWVAATDRRFIKNDIYAAVRLVAKEAGDQVAETTAQFEIEPTDLD